MQKWKKIGRICEPNDQLHWMRSHAMLPTAEHLEGNSYRVYVSGRDSENRSQIGTFEFDITNPLNSTSIRKNPILTHGELGCFDDNGVTPSCLIKNDDSMFLYYIGWKPRSTVRMSLRAGLAISKDNGKTFSRYSRATIFPNTDIEPFSILTAPCVLKEENNWRVWYVSGEGWEHPDLPRYNIKTATSSDGINWDRRGDVSIDFLADGETALARPWVVKHNGLYKMWYSFKPDGITYRMGYAESRDGIKFERMDNELSGLEASEQGWDSQMIEYPNVFIHNDTFYMLYNGNNYGENGVGLAVLEQW